MPNTGDYSLGKIYKLVSHQTEDIYIGSTCQLYLSKRFTGHKRSYESWRKGNTHSHYVTYFDMLKYDDCQIILIENYPCSTKYELEARERYHIENNTCINKVIPTRSKCEYVLATKDKKREYDKQYREQNTEKRTEQKRQYYETNKDRINAKVECSICGLCVSKNYMAKHQQTKTCKAHQNNDEELK